MQFVHIIIQQVQGGEKKKKSKVNALSESLS